MYGRQFADNYLFPGSFMKAILITLITTATVKCFAQSEIVNLDCTQMGDDKTTVSMQIDLSKKTILLDEEDGRRARERLNQLQYPKYLEAVKANDELGKQWLAPKPYEPDVYGVTTISKLEVVANATFPARGGLKINRNSLIAYKSVVMSSGFVEVSYKCSKTSKGF